MIRAQFSNKNLVVLLVLAGVISFDMFFMIFCMAALVGAGKKKKNESNSLDQETNKKTKSKENSLRVKLPSEF